MASKARSSTRRPAKRGAAKRGTAKRGGAAKRSAMKRGATKRSRSGSVMAGRSRRRTATSRRKVPPSMARVKRVTRKVVKQATTAVSTGVDALRDLGENIVERVRQD